MTPTNQAGAFQPAKEPQAPHVSQTEASELVESIGAVETRLYSAFCDASEHPRIRLQLAEIRTKLRRYIAQAGAPEGQAVAYVAKCPQCNGDGESGVRVPDDLRDEFRGDAVMNARESVGVAVVAGEGHDGLDGRVTVAVFDADDVPAGTILYIERWTHEEIEAAKKAGAGMHALLNPDAAIAARGEG